MGIALIESSWNTLLRVQSQCSQSNRRIVHIVPSWSLSLVVPWLQAYSRQTRGIGGYFLSAQKGIGISDVLRAIMHLGFSKNFFYKSVHLGCPTFLSLSEPLED